MTMLSIATSPSDAPSPPHGPNSPSSPLSLRSRRYALLPPLPPSAPESPSSPPIPARSPLRLSHRKSTDTSSSSSPRDPVISKQKHALLELLSSEKAYAADLALIRDVHIPRALGNPLTPLSLREVPPLPPNNASPPMSKDDVKIIFGNIEDLAVLSELFCQKLEEALKGVLDSESDSQNAVANTFISIIPYMKPPYTSYITRHSSALSHLNVLPQTPALAAYLAETRTLAQSYTHAWDLPSLLIKPVQRLLKYPLLLNAIIDDTSPGQVRDNLCLARDKVEEVARSVNEGRRRIEVVKSLLNDKHPPVRLKSIKSLKYKAISQGSGELDAFEKRLHDCEEFVHNFAKATVYWSTCVRDCMFELTKWSLSFGRVIGLDKPHNSEALDLFSEIISNQIMPIWVSLDMAIRTLLMSKLSQLLGTIRQPSRLLEHLHALRPQHLQLLETPITKQRPPNSLVEASQSYIALEAQLKAELPQYIALLERGFLACISQVANWQATFWKEVRAQWVELWDALGVEGDMSAGAIETVKLWWERWEEVERNVSYLQIIKPFLGRDKHLSRSSTGIGPTGAVATSSASLPATPSSSSFHYANRRSVHSIDFDIDTLLQQVSQGFSPVERVASPDEYSIKRRGSGVSTSTKASVKRRDIERPSLSRRNSIERSYVKREYDSERRYNQEEDAASPSRRPSATHTDGDRSSVSRQTQDSSTSGFFTKVSVESATSYAQPSSRVSLHSISSTSSNYRLSTRSNDANVGMDITYLPDASGQHSSASLNNKSTQQSMQEQDIEPRAQLTKSPSLRKRITDAFKSPGKRTSRRTTKSTFDDYAPREIPGVIDITEPGVVEVLYTCIATNPISTEGHALPLYRGRPFLPLQAGDDLDILYESGHPRDHEDLPIRLPDEDGDDCLLLARDPNGLIGWAFASFLLVTS